jgi:hypothetical protein
MRRLPAVLVALTAAAALALLPSPVSAAGTRIFKTDPDTVRVTPPTVLGRDLPEVRAETPR